MDKLNPEKYDEYEYKEIPVQGDEVQIVCPACKTTNDLSVQNYSSNSTVVKNSGQFIRWLKPGTGKWGIPIILTVIVFLIAKLIGVDTALSCSLAVAIGFLGGFWILKDVLEPLIASILAKKIPIWLVSCRNCGASIPVAADNNLFLIGTVPSSSKAPPDNNA